MLSIDVGSVAEEGVAGVEELGGGEEAEVGLERCGVSEDVEVVLHYRGGK